MSSWKCQICDQPVSHGGLGFNFKIWHNKCFCCAECGLSLNSLNYRPRDGKPFCLAHYIPDPEADDRGSFLMLPLAGMKKILSDCQEVIADVIGELVLPVLPGLAKPPAKSRPGGLQLQRMFPLSETQPRKKQSAAKEPAKKPGPKRSQSLNVETPPEEPDKKNRVIVSISAAGDKTMELVIGSICEEKVDVIVNSVGTDLDMKKGELSKALRQEGGVEIEQELQQEGGTQPAESGSVIATKGYRLPCKNVLHAILIPWSNAEQCVQNLRQLVNSILSKADELKASSIAFPPLGIGNLEYPRNAVAQVLYMEVMNYLESNVESGLQQVVFAVLPTEKELIKTFRGFLIGETSGHQKPLGDEELRIYDTLMKVYKTSFCESTERKLLPDWWKNRISSKQPYARYELDPTDKEYRDVLRLMCCRNGRDFTKFVYKIERIENHFLWTVYDAMRQAMVRTNAKGMQNERKLWHGTQVKSLENIIASGFNRCFNGRALYGKGVYFAHQFSYSANDNYSPPDCLGCKYIFQCRVLIGYFCKGTPDLLQPPINTKTGHPYNSAVDSEESPMIFVTFRDYAMYPEYLITLFGN